MQDHAKDFVGDAGNAANDGAQAAIEAPRKMAERAYRLANEAVAGITDDVEEWTSGRLDAARETGRKKPLAAVAVAMGAGALFSAIFLRR
jgi:ElaB/YqjD/DUF883 family membrane-anchored ribosome-binding protein